MAAPVPIVDGDCGARSGSVRCRLSGRNVGLNVVSVELACLNVGLDVVSVGLARWKASPTLVHASSALGARFAVATTG